MIADTVVLIIKLFIYLFIYCILFFQFVKTCMCIYLFDNIYICV